MAIFLFIRSKCDSDESNQTTVFRVNHCCAKGNFYSLESDDCLPLNNSQSSFLPELPSIYDFRSNNTIDLNQLIDAVHLPTCPPDNEIFTIDRFRLYGDGSVGIIEGDDQSSFLKPNEYCLSQIDDSDPMEYFVRFCAHPNDLCSRLGVKCIPKCCPHGMLVNPEVSDNKCQVTSKSFELNFEDNPPKESYKIIGNRLAMSECLSNDFYMTLRPDVNPEDDRFQLLPDGRLYVVEISEVRHFDFDHFCIDDFTTSQGIVRLRAS